MWARQSASGCGLAVGVIVTAGADVITAVDTDTAVFTAVDTDVVVFTAVDLDAVVFTAVEVGGTVKVSGAGKCIPYRLISRGDKAAVGGRCGVIAHSRRQPTASAKRARGLTEHADFLD